MLDLLIKKAIVRGYSVAQDILISDGKFADISENIDVDCSRVIEANSKCIVPGLIESHIHLEKAYVMERKPNLSGTLQEAIAISAELKPTFNAEDIFSRSCQLIDKMVANGTSFVRAHAEFDPEQGFIGLETVLELKKLYSNMIDIQIVAFPQEGIFKFPKTIDMMDKAMQMGCDVVGGIPYNDIDSKQHIDFVFDLAKKYDKDVDLHQDFKDDAISMSIEYLAEKTIAEGYQNRVSVGHLTSLAAVEKIKRKPLIDLISKAGISVMCLPMTDLHLGARNDTCNVRRTIAPIRELRDAGVNVCLATNNVKNAFTPFGTGDLFHVGLVAIPACHLGGADDQKTVLDMLTYNPAKALGIKNYGLKIGNNADCVLLDCSDLDNAVIDQSDKCIVIKKGVVVAENFKQTNLIKNLCKV